MAGSGGLNGLSFGIVTIGGLFIYAGIRGVSPLQALRDVSSGKPTPVPNKPGELDLTGGNVALVGQTGGIAQKALAAVTEFNGDKYSQLLRTRQGYSDCSSFVCKGFHAVGVAKPDGRMEWPNTTAFANSPAWKTVAKDDTKPGDIAVTSGQHMVFITAAGAAQAIGQQNPRSNVKTGTIGELFSNMGPVVITYRTYVGTT